MKISARVQYGAGEHHVVLATDGNEQALNIPPSPSGYGSNANGGELLFLALATCYCNDLYREAAFRGMEIERVDVHVEGEFGSAGAPATGIVYNARVVANAAESEILDLMRHTDTVAEIQRTLRVPTPVTLGHVEAVIAER